MMGESIHPGLHKNYQLGLFEWQDRAEHFIKRNIGFLPGNISHHFHGSKKSRQYHERWKVLVENQYNPITDLRRNDQGVLELVTINSRQIRLRDGLRTYMRQRNEDSIDLG
jgi:hypothetical protein